MKLSRMGLELIKTFEGFRTSPYLCPAGIPTIGYGCTYYSDGRRVRLSDPSIDETSATILLQNILASYERGVDSFTRNDITQNQFDALVSFAYNVGISGLRNSTLLRLVNADPLNRRIRKEFMRSVYADGRKIKGLKIRREREVEMYFAKTEKI